MRAKEPTQPWAKWSLRLRYLTLDDIPPDPREAKTEWKPFCEGYLPDGELALPLKKPAQQK